MGLPLGLLTASFRWCHDTIGILALGLQTLPSVCWVPLALLWFGQTEAAMLFVVVMGTVWSLIIATDNGVRTIPPIYSRAARTMGSTGLHTWTHVVIPAALPFLLSGMKQGWAFAWRSLMAAEIYVTILSGFGLGQLLHYGRELHAMDQVIGVILIIIFIGLAVDKSLFAPTERFMHRRWGTEQERWPHRPALYRRNIFTPLQCLPLKTQSRLSQLPIHTPWPYPSVSCLVFEDPASKSLLERVQRIAPSEATALIIGETGTGKELIARQIHELSDRRSGPFVAFNCAAISESLMESELFGHERAFTGAVTAKAGWFETAQGGSLFLDEIGDLPPPLQAKLLRVIQEREVVRVGSRQAIAINVRLITATNVKLDEAVAAGRFREDLYYRLNVASIHLPTLRERQGDILPLAEHFLKVYGTRLSYTTVELAPETVKALLSYQWPGNIRELENSIHHALLICAGTTVRPEDLRLPTPRSEGRLQPPTTDSAKQTLEDVLHSHQRRHAQSL